MLVSDIIGDQIVLPYSSVVLVMAVYVLFSVYLNFPPRVVVRAFSIFFVLPVRLCMYFKKVCLRSNTRPNIFMSSIVKSVVFFIVGLSFVV